MMGKMEGWFKSDKFITSYFNYSIIAALFYDFVLSLLSNINIDTLSLFLAEWIDHYKLIPPLS